MTTQLPTIELAAQVVFEALVHGGGLPYPLKAVA